jgi:protein TonB
VYAKILETEWISDDFTLGDAISSVPEEVISDADVRDLPEPLPAPPEMVDLTTSDPIPEVPELLPESVSLARDPPAVIHPRAAASDFSMSASRARMSVGKRVTARLDGAARTGGGENLSNAARLAAGRMRSPEYPAEARRQGQAGLLVVEFVVDPAGRVISAYAKSPSPWPLLNQEAIRTVRGWRFPPGPLMKLQRPIVFQLR